MIKNVFVPEQYNGYYVFATRVLGINSNKTQVTATKILLHQRSITIEGVYEQPIASGTPGDHDERLSAAIAAVVKKAGAYDRVIFAISSAHVIFRQLSLPFTSAQKIRMVLDYEIAPLLPVSIDQVELDFIITNIDEQESRADILVAAVQKQHMAQHVAVLQSAGVDPARISVDAIAVYGLYRMIPDYTSTSGVTSIIDLGAQATKIMCMVDGKLELIRTVPHGLSHLAKQLATERNIKPADALDHLMRFGVEAGHDPEYMPALEPLLTTFVSTIQQTIESCRQKVQVPSAKVLLLGEGAQLAGMAQAIEKILGTSTQLFDPNKITELSNVVNASNDTIAIQATVGLAVAMPNEISQDFSLARGDFAKDDRGLFMQQLFAGSFLVLLIIGTLLIGSYLQTSKLYASISRARRQMVAVLDEELEADDLESAQQKVQKLQETWFAFSKQTRLSFLTYLYELSAKIDKQALGLQLTKLSMNQDTITMQGKVKDFESLTLFEEALNQTGLFTYVPDLNETSFNIQLQLKKNEVG